MRNRALDAPFHSTRLAAEIAATAPLALRCHALASRIPESATFSHETAALLHGMPLPYPETIRPLHVTVAAPGRAPRRKGVIGHCAELGRGAVVIVGDVRATSVERTWCDLASILDLPDLVAAGDFLLWHEAPRTTLDLLVDAVVAHGSRRGSTRLRKALPLLSDRSQSRPESLVRVALILSELPDPVANHEVYLTVAHRVIRFDLAFPEYKLGLEYHGDHHRSDRRQWRSDVSRNNDVADEGWHLMQFTGDDLADLSGLRARVERRLRMLGWGG